MIYSDSEYLWTFIKNMRMKIIRSYVKGADQITDNVEKHIKN